jgi:hypothetical protein
MPEDPVPEYQVKTVFVYNLARFTYWPHTALAGTNDFVVCFVNERLALPYADLIEGRLVQGHRVRVTYWRQPGDERDCHLVFMNTDDRQTIRYLLDSLRGKPVLSVGEVPGFAQAGGIINLVKRADRIGIEINVDAVARARLKINAQLLQLARNIHDDGAPFLPLVNHSTPGVRVDANRLP